MRFRKLRIAWSVFWAIVCVLLIGLWVRTYWSSDCFGFSPTLGIGTLKGEITIVHEASGPFFINTVMPGYHKEPPDSLTWSDNTALQKWTLSCVHEMNGLGFYCIGIRIYAIIILGLAIGAFSWIPFRWHFRLRTLLIATTLVAVVLGLIVYAVR